jgi:hypothetical protein
MQVLGWLNSGAPGPLRALAGRTQAPVLSAPQRPGHGLKHLEVTCYCGHGLKHLEVTRYCDWRYPAGLAAVAGVLDGDEQDRRRPSSGSASCATRSSSSSAPGG